MDRLPKDFQAYVDAVSRRMKRNRRRVALERWLSGLKHCASRALYWVPRIALFIVVVVLALFLGSAKSANAQQQDGSLYVTFIPAKAKKAVDPLLLPIDIIRPAKPDENYKRIIADLSANGYAEAKFDLYPDEYRGKCLLVWRDEKYSSACQGVTVRGNETEMQSTLPLNTIGEALVLVRSFSRALNVAPARVVPSTKSSQLLQTREETHDNAYQVQYL